VPEGAGTPDHLLPDTHSDELAAALLPKSPTHPETAKDPEDHLGLSTRLTTGHTDSISTATRSAWQEPDVGWPTGMCIYMSTLP
jgi:hypothetical protein